MGALLKLALAAVWASSSSSSSPEADGALDRAWTFDYVHLTNEMYTRYGEALLEVLRPFVQPR